MDPIQLSLSWENILKKKINILYAHEEKKAKGIRKGLIVDPNLAINAIKDGIKVVNNYLGINIKNK